MQQIHEIAARFRRQHPANAYGLAPSDLRTIIFVIKQ